MDRREQPEEPRAVVLVPPDDPQASDPEAFPTARFAELIRRLPRYLRLAWGLAGEPSMPRSRRAGVVAAAVYLASPVDLIPGVIPVVGQLDDVAIAVLALRAALRAVDEPTRLRILADASMTQDDLDRDVETAGLAALWLGRQGVHLTRRLAGLAAAAALAAARAGGRAASGAARRVVQAGRDAAPGALSQAGRGASAAGRGGVAAAGGGAAAAGRGAATAGRGAATAGRGAAAAGRGAASAVGQGAAAAGGGVAHRLRRLARRGDGAEGAEEAPGGTEAAASLGPNDADADRPA
jgi:uncharacterized membrane protein YkvA (DUF1232 family)